MEFTAKNKKTFQPSLQLTVSFLFIILILSVGGFLSWYHYHVSSKNLLAAAEKNFSQIGRELARDFENLISPAVQVVEFRALSSVMEAKNLEERLRYLPEFKLALEQVPGMTGLQIGYPNSDYFLVKLIRSSEDLITLKAPPGTNLVVTHISDIPAGKHFKQILFFDETFRQIKQNKPEISDFNTLQRPWYKLSQSSNTPIATPPYFFHFARKVGTTIAVRDKKTNAVAGADLTIESLSKIIGSYKITPNSEIVLLGKSGDVFAYKDTGKLIFQRGEKDFELAGLSDLGHPVLTSIANAKNLEPHSFTIKTDEELWRGEILPINIGYDINPRLLITAPESELLADAIKERQQALYITLLILAAFLPIAWLVAQMISKPLRRLALDAERINHFDFKQSREHRSFIKEVDDLAKIMGFMKKTISEFLTLTESLNKEKDFDHLLEKITREAGKIAQTEAVITYLLSDDKLKLEPVAIHCSETISAISEKQLPSLLIKENHGICRASINNKINITIPGSDEKTGFNHFLSHLDNHELTVVALPLQDRQGNSMGVIALLYAHSPGKQPELIQDDRISFIKKMSSLAGVLLETRQLLRMQKELFNSFIKLIAGAIDAKSPYTGGHCQRVPVITKMLATAACEEKNGIFSDFNLTEEQWEELHVASWLHDCGKVTTPDYVVDKATKLETIYDRIHEVRMRFEVLKRDAEIACWQNIAKTGEKEIKLAQLDENITRLDQDFAFIAQCNQGSEFMAPELIERVHKIAQYSWLRTLDNRIGISWEETQRMQRTPAPDLPVQENVIKDREEHLILKSKEEKTSDDNPWGFKLDEPEYRYNRGEVYNLQIAKGTLNMEERFKINDHIVQTIKMLEKLPYPKHLKKVPEIAGGHHETMIGTGYPRRLTGDQMSTTAKMMAIADVFEALTASDRPYKKQKKLSECIEIMSFMHKDGHFDSDLFKLFLTSGVFKSYAEKYLAQEQIDNVNIDAYL